MEACGRIGSAVGYSFHIRREEGFRMPSARQRRVYIGGGTEGFADNEHLKYYTSGVRCGAKTVEEKRRKIMKKLAKDLTAFVYLEKEKEKEESSQVVAAEIGNQEMADVLLAQLKELWAQETMMMEKEKGMKKKMKNKKKEERAMKKMMTKREEEKKATTKMQEDCKDQDMSSSSSSESSESSDSECDEVVDMRAGKLVEGQQSMPCDTVIPAIMFENDSTHQIIEQKSNVTSLLNYPSKGCETSPTSIFNITRPEGDLVVTIPAAAAATAMSMNMIEVCMGGKCKRSGALQLKEEFERIVGIEGAVVGCKCMGKCKEGPNVRVVNQRNEVETSMPLPKNPLCIGVGLEDVGSIMASYFGKNDMGLVST